VRFTVSAGPAHQRKRYKAVADNGQENAHFLGSITCHGMGSHQWSFGFGELATSLWRYSTARTQEMRSFC
jgi:hypothetical protein